MAARAIPEANELEVVRLAGERNPATGRTWTTRELAAWLLEERAVRASHVAVGNVLRRAREERRAATVETIRDTLCRDLEAQLGAVDRLVDEYLVEARTPQIAPDPGPDAEPQGRGRGARPPPVFDRTRYAQVALQALALKLRFSGVGERVELGVDVDVDVRVSPREELARRIAGLAARRGEGGGAGEAG